MNFEYFEADGTKGVGFDAGIKVFGQYSRELAQKSFSIHLRGKYGINSVNYPFFRDSDMTEFSSFLLRQSGQDWGKTKIKDAFIHQAVKDTTSLDVMDYRPCVVYINGEYWGIYNIREKQNEDYVLNHYEDAVKGNVNIVKADTNVRVGSVDGWQAVRDYVKPRLPEGGKENRINTAEATEWVESRVDMKNLMEWSITEIFFCNTDTGNIRQFNYGDSKWKKMLFDLDWGLQTGGYKNLNFLGELLNDAGHGTNNNFQSHMFMAIKYNDKWREEFIELYAQHLNTTFNVDRLCAIVDAMAAEIRPEMARQAAKWGSPESTEKWESNINDLKETIRLRREAAIKELKSYFSLSDSRMSELLPNG